MEEPVAHLEQDRPEGRYSAGINRIQQKQAKDISVNYLIRHGLELVLHLLHERLHLNNKNKKKTQEQCLHQKKTIYTIYSGKMIQKSKHCYIFKN